jgi:tetratricopeptide (TPR) repeat protein
MRQGQGQRKTSGKARAGVPSLTNSTRWSGPLLLFAVVTGIYAPSVRNDFIYDDVQIILGHDAPRGLEDWARIFAERHFPNLPYYRPVTRLTLVAQKWMSGDMPWPFHLANALLMGGAALLGFAILRLPVMGVARGPALAAAALFALHPIASSCVYPISSGRETLLPTVWTLAAVWAFLRGGRGGRAAAMAAFAGALFSKEQGVVAPLLFILGDVLALTPDPPGRSVPAWVRRYWPVPLIAAVFFAIRFALFGGGEFVAGSSAGPLYSLLYAMESIFAPTVELAYEPTLVVWFSPLRLAVAVGALVAISLLARRDWAALRRHACFWLGWFLVVLLPTANLLRQEARFDERYVFPASLAVFAMAARIASLHLHTQTARRYLTVAATALVTVCAAISFARGTYFYDDISFSRQWLRTNPDSLNAHYNLGYTLAKQGKTQEAAAEYQAALRIQPDYSLAHCNLANALSGLGRLDEAMAHYREAVRLDPDYTDAHLNLGVALGRAHRQQEAIQQFREVLRLNPKSATAHNDIGNALAEQGKYAEASAEFRAALRLNPNLADAHNNLANILVAVGQLTAAVAEYNEALRIQPAYADARRNLELVEEHLGAGDVSPQTPPRAAAPSRR